MSSGIHTKQYGYVNRKSMRLKDFDYSRPGAYFVTICVHDKEYLFGRIENKSMILNECGAIVKETWHDLVNHINGINTDESVIMPNHFHGIMFIENTQPAGKYIIKADSDANIIPVTGAGLEPAPTGIKQHALPEIIRQFKTFSARRINKIRQTPGIPMWQHNYYDHIVRDEKELYDIRQYIIDNPANWESDKNYIK